MSQTDRKDRKIVINVEFDKPDARRLDKFAKERRLKRAPAVRLIVTERLQAEEKDGDGRAA